MDHMKAQSFTEIIKFNPYHGSDGRFASASGYASFTYSPGKSKAHDMAIAREKERQAAGAAAGNKAEEKDYKYTKEEQIEAVKGFTIGDYFDIRKIQCGKDPGYMSAKELETFKKKGEAIEEYIDANGPYKGKIYRGMNTDDDLGLKTGQVLDMRGTSSWTTDKKQGYDWAGQHSNGDKGEYNIKSGKERAYVFEMKAPKKSTYIDDISENQGEKEVIVSKTVQFKITGIKETGTQTIVTVEEYK